jgi:2-methylaconitate cis-trans-isomerase PrpF
MFVGEQRSRKAETMGVHWRDGRLAAKQLFDALRACGIEPAEHEYVNAFEKFGANVRRIRAHPGLRVGMGQKVCRFLTAMHIEHVALVHPAARGAIRKKGVYAAHVRDVLTAAGVAVH